MKNTKAVINRVNKYLSLMRYNYSSQEKLMRLKVLEDYYVAANVKASKESLASKIECAEQLKAGELKLPLKVRGVFLKEGRPDRKYYSATELEKAVNNPINNKFPLMLDHKDKEAGKVVGMVDKIVYDPKKRSIKWWGHINNETFARNVLDGAIKEVSVTVFSVTDIDATFGVVGYDLTFKELSLVMDGAVEGNYIEAY